MFKKNPKLSIFNVGKILKIVKDIKGGEFKFDINSEPPTQEDIAERLVILKDVESFTKDFRIINEGADTLFIMSVVLLISFGMSFFVTLSISSIIILAGIFGISYFLKQKIKEFKELSELIRNLGLERMCLNPVSKLFFETLLKACSSSKETKEYHQRIIELRRHFVHGEYEMLVEYSKSFLDKKLVEELYPFEKKNVEEKEINNEKGYKL